MSRSSRAMASSRSSSRMRCWSGVSLEAPSVALSSPRFDYAIQERIDFGSTSNCLPAAATLRCCSMTSLVASLLNSSVNKQREYVSWKLLTS